MPGRVVARGCSVKVAAVRGPAHLQGMTELSRVGAIVRRHDPDRFFTALFAPAEHRDTLFTLYAFNHELARAREAVREPFAALIRLQWWREIIEGARRRHEVAEPLGHALDKGLLHPVDLAGMIDAREAEAEPIESMDAFIAYVQGTAGGVMVAAARALGAETPESLRRPGAAYGVAGILRSAESRAGQGRSVLPAGRDADPALRTELVGLARTWLADRPPIRRPALAASLPLVLAARDLRAPGTRPRGLLDRLAVTRAAALGRV